MQREARTAEPVLFGCIDEVQSRRGSRSPKDSRGTLYACRPCIASQDALLRLSPRRMGLRRISTHRQRWCDAGWLPHRMSTVWQKEFYRREGGREDAQGSLETLYGPGRATQDRGGGWTSWLSRRSFVVEIRS